MGIGFPSQVSSSQESAESCISEQIMQFCGSSCYMWPKILGFKNCLFHFWQLFIRKTFVKSENNTMWSTYFNQQTLIVSLFRIYYIVMHMTNIFWNNKFLTRVQDQNFLFTFLTKDYEAKFRQIAFSELVRISYEQHLPPKFFQYLLT